jgi:hypothetical protein
MSAGRKGLKITIILSLLISSWIILFIPKTLDATVYGKIYGRVVKEDTGQGLRDVRVFLFKDFFNRHIAETKTDENGKYSFEMLQEGQYALLFAVEYWSGMGYYVDRQGDIVEGNILEEELEKRSFFLGKGQHIQVNRKAYLNGEFRAIVKRKDGTRFTFPSEEDLMIDVVIDNEKKESYPLIYDLKKAEFYGKVPPGLYNCEVKSFYGYPTQRFENIRIEKGKTTLNEFIIDLDNPTGIEGKVIRLKDGKAISGERLTVYQENSGKEICELYTDNNGHYSVVGLSPGTYKIVCWADFKPYRGIIVTQGKKTWFDIKVEKPLFEKDSSLSNLGSHEDTYQLNSFSNIETPRGPSSSLIDISGREATFFL